MPVLMPVLSLSVNPNLGGGGAGGGDFDSSVGFLLIIQKQ